MTPSWGSFIIARSHGREHVNEGVSRQPDAGSEVERLAAVLNRPTLFIERRVETLDFQSDGTIHVSTSQQFVCPPFGRREAVGVDDAAAQEARLLVPVGYFAKGRLPDLVVLGPAGERLPVLSRSDRAALSADLFALRFRSTFIGEAYGQSRIVLQAAWTFIESFIRVIAVELEDVALRVLNTLEDQLLAELESNNDDAVVSQITGLFDDADFWDSLTVLASTALLVAFMNGKPGTPYVIQIDYSENPEDPRPKRFGTINRILVSLGFTYVEVSRRVVNFGSTLSLWVIAQMPPEAETLRFYWASQEEEIGRQDAVVNRDAAVLGSYDGHRGAVDQSILHFQLRPSADLVSAIALSALLAVVATYSYEQSSLASSHDPGLLIAFFAAVPGIIAGRLAYGGHRFLRLVSKWPRFGITAMSVLSLALSASLTMRGFDSLSEYLSIITAVQAVSLGVALLYIQCGSRWRQNGHSRRLKKVSTMTPGDCKKEQQKYARIALAVWLGIVILFAVGEIYFRRHQIF